MAKNEHKKLFTIKTNQNKINMGVNESNYNHFQSLSPNKKQYRINDNEVFTRNL
jgi:hypothetical protein